MQQSLAHRTISWADFTLCAGLAHGVFRERNLVGGAHRLRLAYGERSAGRGTLAVGAPGSSNAARLHPDFLFQATSPRAGALTAEIHGFGDERFLAIAREFNKNHLRLVGIGTGRATMDIQA